jgi:threonine synthase
VQAQLPYSFKVKWISTGGRAPAVTFRDALFAGLAPDGGLYLPERIEPLPPSALSGLDGRSLPEVGTVVAAELLGSEITPGALGEIVRDALNFSTPLVDVGDKRIALELFHGPTFAFKDVGARVMARLMAHFIEPGAPLTVLVATSGDTGSAVAHAFAGLSGTRVVVLYPDGQVSDVQEAQMATLGGNVRAVAVAGTFDDCQALVKAAFADRVIRERSRLTSANSINVGRLAPQVFYYAWGALQRPNRIWSVPSGNFGNLTAGLIARRLGFPIRGFVAATNVNDVVPQYLASGQYEPRPSVRTVANAMDVGAPSNVERMRHLYADDRRALSADVRGVSCDDARVSATIADVYARYGYTLDPHTAIAWLGLPDEGGVFVATAHPAKFRETVEPAIGRPVALPEALRAALGRPRQITRMAPSLAALESILESENHQS